MKNLGFILLPVLIVLVFSVSVNAGGFAALETTAKLKDMFGFNGLVSGNGAPPSFSPAIGMCDGAKVGVESVYGHTDFSQGLGVDVAGIYLVKAIDKKSVIRLGRYTVFSDTALTRISDQDIKLSLTTQTIELAFGHKIGSDLYVGVSMAPETLDATYQTKDNFNQIEARAKSTWNYRWGVSKIIDNVVELSAIYAQDSFGVDQIINGIPVPRVNYKQKSLTFGINIMGLFTLSKENRSLRGVGVDQNQNIWGYSLVLPVSSHLFLNWTKKDRSIYGLQYCDRQWNLGLAISHDDYHINQEVIGTGKSAYIWAGQQF